jgi:hypothetical protein
MSDDKIKKSIIGRIFSDKQYEWMLRNFPFKLMYKKVPFDGHYLWLPRYGVTKSMKEKAEKQAEKWLNGIKWD